MGIIFDEKNQTFTLHTAETTYQMKVDSYGFLLHLYYGRRAEGCMDHLPVYADRGFSGTPGCAGTDRTYSLDVMPQEFPTMGAGDLRSTALVVENTDGSRSCCLQYKGYSIQDGKYALPGLPAVYGGE